MIVEFYFLTDFLFLLLILALLKFFHGFVFEDFAVLVDFFTFFKGVSEDTELLNRIDFSLLKNLEIIATYK